MTSMRRVANKLNILTYHLHSTTGLFRAASLFIEKESLRLRFDLRDVPVIVVVGGTVVVLYISKSILNMNEEVEEVSCQP